MPFPFITIVATSVTVLSLNPCHIHHITYRYFCMRLKRFCAIELCECADHSSLMNTQNVVFYSLLFLLFLLFFVILVILNATFIAVAVFARYDMRHY